MASVGRKVVRAFLIGTTIGIVAGLGLYFMTDAINLMAAPATPYNPVAVMVLCLGFCMVAAVGIELSGDIAADTEKGSTQKG